jgi:acyl carrier protein
MSVDFKTLQDIFVTELADPSLALTPETVLADIPGWDSVNLSCVILGVETRFGIELTPAQMDHLETVGDFLTIIEADAKTAP